AWRHCVRQPRRLSHAPWTPSDSIDLDFCHRHWYVVTAHPWTPGPLSNDEHKNNKTSICQSLTARLITFYD
ncbi:hypothetical protein ACRALDRAFT_2034668, partial [Sodiomyces alcalophilus JCM 7366]|uniref:uncharacterized protein n=1 Tax=Sodiomyces alcalophilus JCM 7366 TaxID=591952 RepID=UPI0039B569DF